MPRSLRSVAAIALPLSIGCQPASNATHNVAAPTAKPGEELSVTTKLAVPLEPKSSTEPGSAKPRHRLAHLFSPWLALDERGKLRCRGDGDCAELEGTTPLLMNRSALIASNGRLYRPYSKGLVSLPSSFRAPTQAVADLGWAVQDAEGNIWCLLGCSAAVERVDQGSASWFGPVKAPPLRTLVLNERIGCGIEQATGKLACWQPRGAAPSVPGLHSLAAGSEHVCALTTAGQVTCWGDASFGEVGFVGEAKYDDEFGLAHGTQRFVQLAPRKKFLELPAPAKEIYAGDYMSCAWLENEEFWCWGDTYEFPFAHTNAPQSYVERMTTGRDEKGHELYKPTFASTLPSSPLEMPDDCRVTDITVISRKICVVCDSGCAQCWGFNLSDSLGYGDSKERWEPRNGCLEF